MTKIRFKHCPSEIPLISLMMDSGESCLAVIDTGSEQTIFDETFINEHKDDFAFFHTKEGYNMIGVATETQTLSRTIMMKAHVGKDTLSIYGITADLSNLRIHFKKAYGDDYDIVCILGSDMLKCLNAKINMKQGYLTLE